MNPREENVGKLTKEMLYMMKIIYPQRGREPHVVSEKDIFRSIYFSYITQAEGQRR